MTRRIILTSAAAMALLAGGCGGRGGDAADQAAATAAAPVDTAYVASIDAWHAGRVARLTTDTGWLTLVGLHALKAGPNRVGSAEGADVRLVSKAPAAFGVITVEDVAVVRFSPEAGVDVRTLDHPDAPVPAGSRLFTDLEESTTVLVQGSLTMHVIDRDGRLFLRVKDREADALKQFAGIARFPVDPAFRVTARIEPGSGTVSVPNVLGQVSEEPSPGTLVFNLAGQECRLTPTGAPGEGLFIVFGDATNGPSTYPGGRFLSTEAPAADGTVVLDFNQATNPPCAFSEYATCPLPPAGNTLAVAVTAGEKRYAHGPAHGEAAGH